MGHAFGGERIERAMQCDWIRRCQRAVAFAARRYDTDRAVSRGAMAGVMKRRPSVLPPAMATNTSPRLTVRLSAVTPLTSISAWRASNSESADAISRSFMLSFLHNLLASTMRLSPYLLSLSEASI